jgi:hypothetical protein
LSKEPGKAKDIATLYTTHRLQASALAALAPFAVPAEGEFPQFAITNAITGEPVDERIIDIAQYIDTVHHINSGTLGAVAYGGTWLRVVELKRVIQEAVVMGIYVDEDVRDMINVLEPGQAQPVAPFVAAATADVSVIGSVLALIIGADPSAAAIREIATTAWQRFMDTPYYDLVRDVLDQVNKKNALALAGINNGISEFVQFLNTMYVANAGMFNLLVQAMPDQGDMELLASDGLIASIKLSLKDALARKLSRNQSIIATSVLESVVTHSAYVQ